MDNDLSKKVQYFTEIATEYLIKFMKIVLKKIGGDIFNSFSNLLYLAKNVKDHFCNFVVYLKCYKLHNKQDVDKILKNDNISILRCNYIEFSNSATHKLNLCQMVLAE